MTADGVVATIAGGSRSIEDAPGDGLPATEALIFPSGGIVVEASGTIYFAEPGAIRMISPDGTLSTFARAKEFNGLAGMAKDADGNFLLTEFQTGQLPFGPSYVLRVSPAGETTVLAGNGTTLLSGDGMPAVEAQLAAPGALATDAEGNLFVADRDRNLIRQISHDGTIMTANLPRWAAPDQPRALAVDTMGLVYYASAFGNVWQFYPANPEFPILVGFSRDVMIRTPAGLAIDASRNVYVSDSLTSRVYKMDTARKVTAVAGNGKRTHSGDGGPATEAGLEGPTALALDSAGNLYIAESGSGYVRKVDSGGTITTFAGNGERCGCGPLGDGGLATEATIDPEGIAVDSAGNVYIADTDNARVRKVSPDGIIRTIAGGDDWGYSGDGGPATNAALAWPYGIAVDAAGNVFVGDTGEGAVRVLRPQQ